MVASMLSSLTTSMPALLAEGSLRTTFELGRVHTIWDWILPVAVLVVLAWFVIGMYLLDCVELGARRAILLISMRMLALIGLLAVYLQPQWRTERDVVNNSRVMVLVDTSQSMQRVDADSSGGTSSDESSRIDQVVNELNRGDLVPELRKVHDVVVYRFDQDERPTAIATLPKIEGVESEQKSDKNRDEALTAAVDKARDDLTFAGIILGIGVAGMVWYLLRPATEDLRGAALLVVATICLLASATLAVWAMSGSEQVTIRDVLGLSGPEPIKANTSSSEKDLELAEEIDWSKVLLPRGSETRLGSVLAQIVEDERATPIAGILVLSDGQENAGLSSEAATKLAAEAGIPVHCVGLGSARRSKSILISDFAAPSRVFPDDPFEITVYLQSQGLAGRPAEVFLRQVKDDDSSQPPSEALAVAEEQDVTLGEDEENVSLKFQLDGIKEPGRYAFELGVTPSLDREIQETKPERFFVEVVLQKTKVLVIAGGPTREYRFLRNMLYRDKQSEVDVWLQSAQPDISQDADAVLTDFPETEDELFAYDCVVAIDPDWTLLSSSQVDLLERWVADEGGGLLTIPGQVYAGSPVRSWIDEPTYRKIQDMYPVQFHGRFSQLNDEYLGKTEPDEILLTRSGSEVEFLQLGENARESERTWASAIGVYGAFAVVGAKPAATVYAEYDDPEAEGTGSTPIYMAGQFYGSGRVFYIGSGEFWRMRRLGDGYFEQIYVNLIRHVSQGRLLRGSKRGDVLLLEQSRYFVGDTVPIVAHLKDAQRNPLDKKEVTLYVFSPNGKSRPLVLKADQARKGMYRGQFPATKRGDYRLELPLFESEEEPLSKTLTIATSAAEDERPERNDLALTAIATSTGGEYFVGLDAATGRGGNRSVASRLIDQTQITPVLGDTDEEWATLWARWMMFGICGLLCLEWLTRRLMKLA